MLQDHIENIIDSLNGEAMPVLFSKSSQLPKRKEKADTVMQRVFNSEAFPSRHSKFNDPKESPSVKSDFLFYDGTKNTFSEQKTPRTRQRKKHQNAESLVPRPTNSFICARSMLYKLFEKLNISTIECSNIMSDVSKLLNFDTYLESLKFPSFSC